MGPVLMVAPRTERIICLSTKHTQLTLAHEITIHPYLTPSFLSYSLPNRDMTVSAPFEYCNNTEIIIKKDNHSNLFRL